MAGIIITEENFDSEVLHSDLPVLVDFWAEWCPPCKMLSPVIDDIAARFEGRLKVGKINVDEQGLLAAQYSVVNIPTLLLFKDGQAQPPLIGYRPAEEIESFLDPFVKKA